MDLPKNQVVSLREKEKSMGEIKYTLSFLFIHTETKSRKIRKKLVITVTYRGWGLGRKLSSVYPSVLCSNVTLPNVF